MKLVFSKSRFIGRIYALLMGFTLLFLSGFFFFDILAASQSSDFSSNLNSIIGATEGSYWSGANAVESMHLYSVEIHYYFWLGVLGSVFEDQATLLRVLTLIATFMLVFPTLFSASQLKNKILLFALLFVLFTHPRFLDLVIGNIRSALALVFVFYSLRVKGGRLKFFLMGIAVTFHLSMLAPIFLHLMHLLFRRLTLSRSHSDLAFWLLLLVPGVLIMAAKITFPERGGGDWEGGLLYTASIFSLAAYTFFIGKKQINDEFCFVSLGLLSLVIWGAFVGYATMRYFSFFFPFFAVMMLGYDRKPQILTLTFIVWFLFTIASHSIRVGSL